MRLALGVLQGRIYWSGGDVNNPDREKANLGNLAQLD